MRGGEPKTLVVDHNRYLLFKYFWKQPKERYLLWKHPKLSFVNIKNKWSAQLNCHFVFFVCLNGSIIWFPLGVHLELLKSINNSCWTKKNGWLENLGVVVARSAVHFVCFVCLFLFSFVSLLFVCLTRKWTTRKPWSRNGCGKKQRKKSSTRERHCLFFIFSPKKGEK